VSAVLAHAADYVIFGPALLAIAAVTGHAFLRQRREVRERRRDEA
jgi:hypothetical protein